VSLWERLRTFFTGKTAAALDRLEDPAELLDVAYRKQVDALQRVKRGVADVLTAEKRLEIEAQQIRAAGTRFHIAARAAASRGDDDAARRSLQREAFAEFQLGRLDGDIAEVRAQRAALEASARTLEERVELFRTQKLALGAKYAAAKAAAHAGETLTGLSEPMTDVVAMVERAREKSLQTQARAEALAQLASSDAATEADAPDRMPAALVEERLLAIKAESPPALEP
jgi:phage shock protein A